MRTLRVLVLIAVAMAGIAADIAWSNEQCPQMNLNIIGARKQLSNDWAPTTELDEFWLNFDFAGVKWPISIDFAYMTAVQKGKASDIISVGGIDTAVYERESKIDELGAGIKKIWKNDQDFSLFLGAGATVVRGTLNFINVKTFDETKLGWYGTTGAYYTLAKFLNLGIIGRYSSADITVAGRSVNAGGWHYGFLVGFQF